MIAAVIRDIEWAEHDLSIVLPKEIVLVAEVKDETLRDIRDYLKFLMEELQRRYKCGVKDFVVSTN